MGEIGHMILDQNDPELCSCGSRGCAERLVSVARVRKMIAGDPPPEDSPLSRLLQARWELSTLFMRMSNSVRPRSSGHMRIVSRYFPQEKRKYSGFFPPSSVESPLPEELYGVSLSSSGIVDYDHLTLKYSVHTPNWGANVPIGDYLRGIFGPGPALSEENAGKSISRSDGHSPRCRRRTG